MSYKDYIGMILPYSLLITNKLGGWGLRDLGLKGWGFRDKGPWL